jgi:hypothetical protein
MGAFNDGGRARAVGMGRKGVPGGLSQEKTRESEGYGGKRELPHPRLTPGTSPRVSGRPERLEKKLCVERCYS